MIARLFIFATALALLSRASAAEAVTLTGRAMGTTWTVKYLPPDPPHSPLDPVSVRTSIAARLEELEAEFSTYRPASELSRFNASASTNWIPVSPDVVEVARLSRRVAELTEGAFDPTVFPLVRLWGFGPERRTDVLPTDAEITSARLRVDYRGLQARPEPAALRKTYPALAADLSSMAKGFAADAVSKLLASLGAPDHFAQIGGDIKTSGHAVDSLAWRTGIENPSTPATLAAVVALAGESLSTSGATHNFTTIAGQRYGHIIDPRTGRPAASALVSVSVIHSSCAFSSALATALFVLGPDAGPAFAAKEHLFCLFLIRDGDKIIQRTTPEFERYLVKP